ncbi:unnamed protein product [Paramecium primaurelia]|uniref:Uncharacterized protein n=1 Tax=Paramecium primaurelia TaxID=5886 RepID=A0A8S1PTZ1_PARPR|nr:unnamed protein product [Paramecium primaurelia]
MIQIFQEIKDSFAQNPQSILTLMLVVLQKVIELFTEKQNEKMELVQRIINHPIKIIKVVFEQIQELKSKLVEQFAQLINILSNWILNLKQIEGSYSQYSFQEWLENFKPNQENISTINKNYYKKILQINQSSKQKSELDYVEYNQDIENLEQQIHLKSLIKIKLLIKDEKQILQEKKQTLSQLINLQSQMLKVIKLLLILLGQL